MMKRRSVVFARAIAFLIAICLIVCPCSPAYAAKNSKNAEASTEDWKYPEDLVTDKGEDIVSLMAYVALVMNYYFYEDIDTNAMVKNALSKAKKGMTRYEALKLLTEELNDPYSYYYTPDEFKNEMDSSEGRYCGIGATIQKDEKTGALRIVETYKKSPARKAGIKAGDLVYKVDGKKITKKTITEIQNMVKGEKGTEVVLTVKRKGKYVDIKVVRDEVVVETVSYELITDDIGYIKVSQFEGMTAGHFNYAIGELLIDGMKKLVIDLRDNPGGLVDTVVKMIDRLVGDDKLVTYLEDKSGNRVEYYTQDEWDLDIPIVILVNGSSASASELFTGAMRDYEKATIIGTTTFGKGIAQGYLNFTDGSALKLTTSKYYTPNGENIHKKGITPDLILEDDPKTKEDEVIELAIDMLNR